MQTLSPGRHQGACWPRMSLQAMIPIGLGSFFDPIGDAATVLQAEPFILGGVPLGERTSFSINVALQASLGDASCKGIPPFIGIIRSVESAKREMAESALFEMFKAKGAIWPRCQPICLASPSWR